MRLELHPEALGESTSPLYRMPSAGGEEDVLIDCVMSRALSVTPPNNLYHLGCTPGTEPLTVHKRDLTTGRDEVLGAMAKRPRNIVLGLSVSRMARQSSMHDSSNTGRILMMLEKFR